jgi:hypothetical protein
VSAVARRPVLSRYLVQLVGACPWLAVPAVQRINGADRMIDVEGEAV